MLLPEPNSGKDFDSGNAVLALTAIKPVSYEVEHTRCYVFDPGDRTLARAASGRPVFLIVDESLWSVHGPAIEHYAHTHLDCLGTLTVPGTEANKSLGSVEQMCGAAFEKNLPRHGAFVAIGGGTVLDAVGFAASIYRRGVAYLRVPTTLIGMIDVGVGIKQAVNFGHKKNALGSFYPPLRTINDARFLTSLSRRQLACGVAEALKIGLACDGDLFMLIEEHAGALVSSGFRDPGPVGTEILLRSEAAMMKQLEMNLYESDLRRLADFGHSFSPLLESATQYEIAHGEAVALDILVSAALAAGRGRCPASLVGRLQRLYTKVGLPRWHRALSALTLERALVEVKAHRGGALNLVIPTAVGSAEFIAHVGYDEIVGALSMLAADRSDTP